MYTALALAKDGYRVYGTMRDTAKADTLYELAQKDSLDIRVLPLDVQITDTINDAIRDILDESGRIDVLVNNAGYGQFGTLEDISITEHRKQFETNYFGVVSVIQSVLPAMRAQKEGRIINVGSVAGRMGFPCSSPYIGSKFALEGLTESLRYELDPFGIQTTVIEPGVVRTSFFKSLKIAEPTNVEYQKMLDQIMSGLQLMVQMGTHPKDVAFVILRAIHAPVMLPRYLAGTDASMFMEAKSKSSDIEFETYMKKELFPQ